MLSLRAATGCAALALVLLVLCAADADAARAHRLRQRVSGALAVDRSDRETHTQSQSQLQRLDVECVKNAWKAKPASLAAGLTAYAQCLATQCVLTVPTNAVTLAATGNDKRSKALTAVKNFAVTALQNDRSQPFAKYLDTALYKKNAPTFTRDDYGRPTRVVFTPPLTVATTCGGETGNDAGRGTFYAHTTEFVGLFAYAGDHAGHIVAFEFGGSNYANNFWPASPNCNVAGSNWRLQEEYVTAQLKKNCAVTVTVGFQYADPNRPFRATHGQYAVASSGGSDCVSQTLYFVNVPTDKGASPRDWLKGMATADPTADVTPIDPHKGKAPPQPEHTNQQWLKLLTDLGVRPTEHTLPGYLAEVLRRASESVLPAHKTAEAVRASDAYKDAHIAVQRYRALLQTMYDKRNDLKGDDLASAKEELATARRLATSARNALTGHYYLSLRQQAFNVQQFLNEFDKRIDVVEEVLKEEAVAAVKGEDDFENALKWK